MTFFPKNHFIQNWSVIKTTLYAHAKKYIFKIKLWDWNFHQILPRYVYKHVDMSKKGESMESWFLDGCHQRDADKGQDNCDDCDATETFDQKHKHCRNFTNLITAVCTHYTCMHYTGRQ